MRKSSTRVGKDKVYATLVDEILSGRLEAGTPISERALVDRFEISRTPIRQVLWQLERDDLIDFHPHRGAFVKKMGADDVGDLFQLREALEPLACALAAQRRPQDELLALRSRFHALESDNGTTAGQLVSLGGELHDAVVRWSGNHMLLRIYGTIHMQTRLMRNLLHGSLGSEWISLREHVVILEAIQRRDAPAAQDLMTAHLQRSRVAVLEHLFGKVPDRGTRPTLPPASRAAP